MLKSGLIKKLCDLYPNMIHRDLEKAVYVFFNEIVDTLSKGARCELRNFGTFKMKTRKAREARNPKTGDKILIKEKKIPSFKMSQKMMVRLNDKNNQIPFDLIHEK